MKTIKLAGKSVEIYDAIDELPIIRFHKYNKMLLIDAGVGSDLADFDKHFERILQYLNLKDTKAAVTELQNLRQNVYFIQSNISPRNLAFATLVKSVDGKECNDLSDDGLRKTLELFNDAPAKAFASEADAVKKKIDEDLRLYFPKLFDDAAVKEYYDQLRKRTLLVLHSVINGKATEKETDEINKLTTLLITYFNPKIFQGSESVEIKHDKDFEDMCLVISQNLHVDPKKFTVLEYYNAFEYLKDMARKNKAKS